VRATEAKRRSRALLAKRGTQTTVLGEMPVARALGVLGLAEALGELVLETEPELRLKDLLRPERKHASKPRRKPFINSEK
jgi:hypothetical protein